MILSQEDSALTLQNPYFRYAFVGDYSGLVTVLRLEESGVTLINVLKGHNGSIQTITWDGKKGWLFTGKFNLT